MKYVAMIYANPANQDLFPAEERPEVLARQEARDEIHRGGGPLDASDPKDAAGIPPADQGAV
ncbi:MULTISPECIES: hypothetical protein [unclassified Streptomyces]|uniref:hypothetical protein n=1 Tax=unclassified Streptomyces TaxID=2593676 RepID=UPI0036F77189